ncbi:MAG: NADH-quinone oxidoreductase subunit NuoF [Armatimonadota bacterium]
METPLTGRIKPNREPLNLAEYRQAGGYEGLRQALGMTPLEVQQAVATSGLRGRGGAGYPTGQKWSFTDMSDQARHPKYFCVNADEMEPGTMKDRWLLEGDPHQVIEGAIISSYAIQADIAFIFLRWEYRKAYQRLAVALREAEQAGIIGESVMGSPYKLKLHLHVSAGRYMCGEEEGLIDALEGKRAIPRSKPPYPQTIGLFGKPTVINNVETVCCVPHIIKRGAEWFRSLALTNDAGTKVYGASGHLRQPGLWELPMGTSLGQLLEGHAGGMAEGYKFRALLPGGASTGFVTDEHLCTPMDFDGMDAIHSRLGTGTIIVLDDRTCPVDLLCGIAMFFARESCGWCTPCREGLPWVMRTLAAIEAGDGQPSDLDILEHHVEQVRMGLTFCALAPAAMMPIESALRYFREDFERHIREHRCPWRT